MKLDLRVRDLKTGSTKNQPFATLDEARIWLKDRPRFVEVLGIASHHVSPEVSNELKALNRPLDEEEERLRKTVESAQAEAQRLQLEEQQRVQAAAVAAQLKEQQTADPNRPLELRYTYRGDLTVTTAGDDREITEAAREAVLAWVAERNEWVESRGQVVGDANLRVYPGPVPDGEERIVSGTFIPVTASKSNASPSD
jgi:hypothetical protein